MKKILLLVLIFVVSLVFGQTSEEYFNEGSNKFLSSQNYEGAILDYTKAINLNPKYLEAFYWRGKAKHDSGDFQSAINDFTKVIEIDPKNENAYIDRGRSKNEIGDYI